MALSLAWHMMARHQLSKVATNIARCARVGHQVPRAGESTLQAVEAQGEVTEVARCGRVDPQCSRAGLETVTMPPAVAQGNVCFATAIVSTQLPVLLNACTRAAPASSPATSPSQHRGGFLRKAEGPEGQEVYQEVSILVDSGSQQQLLCSTNIAESMGAKGRLSSFALQAG
jgi:hypothetical protein